MRALDALVDRLVDAGGIDPDRIYVTGHSNGAIFAMLYAVARHVTPTPGGHRVAAAAVYAGFDPFNDLRAMHTPSCALDPYPTTTVPIYQVHRACDSLVACDEAQNREFLDLPGGSVEGWLETLRTTMGDPNVEHAIIDFAGVEVDACTRPLLCTSSVGLVNHLRWPDGIDDGGGQDWEVPMLAFLRDHPLP